MRRVALQRKLDPAPRPRGGIYLPQAWLLLAPRWLLFALGCLRRDHTHHRHRRHHHGHDGDGGVANNIDHGGDAANGDNGDRSIN